MTYRKRVFLLVSFLAVCLGTGVFILRQQFTYAQSLGNIAQSRTILVDLDEPEWRQNMPLRALVNESRVIAIGIPIRGACRPSQDGNQVTTDYDVRLQEVIKGNFQPDSVISVSVPGGLVSQDDGSLLVVRSRHIRKMQNGKTYILFLKNAPAGSNTALAVIRGSQGLYEIPSVGTRVIHLGRSFLLPPGDDGEEVSVFLRQLRDLVRNH